MSRSYAKALDDTLRPVGFERAGDDWVRVRGDMWECVNRQSSNLSGVTVNLSVKDLVTEKLFLEIFGGDGAILLPPIQARIGEIIDGYDRWWTSNEPNGMRCSSTAFPGSTACEPWSSKPNAGSSEKLLSPVGAIMDCLWSVSR